MGKSRNFALGIICIGLLSGCFPTTSVVINEKPTHKVIVYDGEKLTVSTKNRTAASIGSKTISQPNDKSFELLVIAENKSASEFIFNTESINVTVNGKSAKVYTYAERKKIIEKQRDIALIATALGGAMEAYGNSMNAGYQTTSGSFSGTTYGNYGSYNTFGTYNSTTYNAAAAQAASAQSQANTNNQMDRISQNSNSNLSDLKYSYLKASTMNKNSAYGGSIIVAAPKLKKGEKQLIEVKVSLGSDLHSFTLQRRFDPK